MRRFVPAEAAAAELGNQLLQQGEIDISFK
jgi:hypothetical protein